MEKQASFSVDSFSVSLLEEAQESRLVRKSLAAPVTLKPWKSHSLLCRPQSLKVPLLVRLFGGFEWDGVVGEETFESVEGIFWVVAPVPLVSIAAGFGDLERERGI